MSTIEEYNQYLINNNIDIEQNDYIEHVHSKFYNYINLEFVEYFTSLVYKQNEFCVEHQKLIDFGIIKENKDNSIIKGCITNKNYGFTENIDYIILTPERSGVKRTGRGGSNGNAKYYNMKPKVFKKLLMRSKNENKYSDYYLMLEDIVCYFKDYRLEYNKNLIKNISKENKKLHDNIEELLKYGKRTTEKLDETNEKLDDIKDELNDVKEELDETAEKLDDLHDKFDDMKDAFEETAGLSVPNPEEEEKRSEFVLLQSRDDPSEFKFMRGIQKYNEVRLNNLYAGEYNIIKREYNANPIQLFNLLKKVVKEELDEAKDEIRGNRNIKNKRQLYKEMVEIKFTSTKLILMNNFTLNDLLRKIKNVADMKFKGYEDATEDAP